VVDTGFFKGVLNVGQGSGQTSYSTALLCVCDYDAFKYRVKLGANKLETEKLFASFRPMRL